MNKRLHALCDLAVSAVREYVGLHDDYDGRVQDLSLEGVRAGLARLGGPPLEDPLDDAYVTAHEHAMRVELGELELHRRNPLYHIGGLDLSCYDRDYAPAEQRAEARRGHLAAWPGAIDAAVGALDRVSAPVAQALLPVVRGLAADLDPADPLAEKALAAHARLVEHVEACARDGDPDASLGAANLDLLLSASEATEVDLGRLEEQADAERDRLRAMLADACQRLAPGRQRRAADPALDRVHRGLGPLRGRGLPRRGVPRRRPAVRGGGRGRVAAAGHPPGRLHRPALRVDERRRRHRPVPVRLLHPRLRRQGRGDPRDLRPHLRSLHLGQAGDPPPPRAGTGRLGQRLLPPALPHRPAGDGLAAAGPARPRPERRWPDVTARMPVAWPDVTAM